MEIYVGISPENVKGGFNIDIRIIKSRKCLHSWSSDVIAEDSWTQRPMQTYGLNYLVIYEGGEIY